MRCQPLRGAHLIVPAKPSRAVGCELDVIGRISVDEILRTNRQRFNIAIGKSPVFKNRLELRKVVGVSDRLVTPKWHIEFAALIEAAESVEASPVEIVEELRRLGALQFAVSDQLIEPTSVPVETLLFVSHLDRYLKTALQMRVKVYQVGIDVIQDGALWSQTEWACESAAEGLNVAPG